MTSFTTRARIAWDILRGTGPRQTKASPLLWPTWRGGNPVWNIVNVQNYIDQGFNQNTLIYSAIMYKVRSMSAAPMRAYSGDVDNPEPLPATSDLAQLVYRPNGHQSWTEFHSQNVVYLNISGNAFIFLDRKGAEDMPAAMYSLRPDRVFVVPMKKNEVAFWYVPEGKAQRDGLAIVPQDMVHVKLPNPADPLEGMGYGLSPIGCMARSADVDNEITRFLKLFFERGAATSGILKFKIPMDDATVAGIKERWRQVYGGVDNWADIGVLGDEGEYQRVGLTFDEMGFGALDERNESRILGPFGVPPILIGTRIGLARSTYSNYEEARRAFWEDTMIPESRLFETEFQYYLRREGVDEFVRFDYTNVPALQKNVPELTTAAYQLWTMGVPANDAFTRVGMDFEIPGGDVSYLPIGVMPVNVGVEPEQTMTGAETPSSAERQGKSAKMTMQHEAKLRYWKAVDAAARAWERRFERAARQQLGRDRRALAAIISGEQKAAYSEKRTISYERIAKDAAEYLAGASGDDWRETFIPLFTGVIEDQAERMQATFGIQFDIRNLEAEEWFDEYTLKFAQEIGKTTKDDIGSMLQRAQHDGWSIPKMQAGLESLFGRYTDDRGVDCGAEDLSDEDTWFCERQPAYRREMIARTETIRASNAGSYNIMLGAGVEQKEWLSTPDDRTRDEHRVGTVWGKAAVVVGIDEPFSIGGEDLQYPGDPSGSPGNTINCRCTVLPVME